MKNETIRSARETSIVTVWGQLGFTPPNHRGSPVCSPFRTDRHPSCQLGGAKNIFTDYATDESLDTIELVRRARGCSFREAIEFILGTSETNFHPESVNVPRLPAAAPAPSAPPPPDPDALRRHRRAARTAKALWLQATPADPAHPYLAAKCIEPHEARQLSEDAVLKQLPSWQRFAEGSGPWLVLPVVALTRSWRGMQLVTPSGRKLLLPGTRKQGAAIPVRWQDSPSDVWVAEGFATACSVAEAMQQSSVFAAIDAGNLRHVAIAARDAWPDAPITMAADNDANGVGQAAARAAAEMVNGNVSIPASIGSDWNDILTGKVARPLPAPPLPAPPPDYSASPAKVARLVLEHLRAYPGSSPIAIATATNVPLMSVRSALDDLHARRRAAVTPHGCFPVNRRAVARREPPVPSSAPYSPAVDQWRQRREGSRIIWLQLLRDLIAAIPYRGHAWLALEEAAGPHGFDSASDLLDALDWHLRPFGGEAAHPETSAMMRGLRLDLNVASDTVSIQMIKSSGRELLA